MPSDKRYTVEGFWDCGYCGTEGIPGRFKACTNCGHPRDESVRFYTKEVSQDQAITHEEFARERDEAERTVRSTTTNYGGVEDSKGGPTLYDRKEGQGRGDALDATDATDWLCDFCGSYNPATLEECRYCAAPRSASEGKTYEQVAGKVARTYDDKGNLVKERDLSTRRKREAPKPEPTTRKGPSPLLIGGIVVGIAMLIFALVGLFSPKAKDITVQGFDWERTIAIEQLQTVQESDWSLPEGARLKHKSREVRSYNHVLDHYETVEREVPKQVIDHYETYTTTVDNGDGTFDVEEHKEPVYVTEYRTETSEEPVYVDVPIYDTKYYYEIERWVHERDVTTSGNDHSPAWGKPTLSETTGDHGTGAEREGERSGVYGVTDTQGNRYTADEELWSSLSEGDELTVFVDGNGHMTPKQE